MGFQLPDFTNAYFEIRRSAGEINNTMNDGWTASGCKKELYQLKCFLEDTYAGLPTFAGEEKWEQERLIKKLKQKE